MEFNNFNTTEFVNKYYSKEKQGYDDKNVYNQVENLLKEVLENKKHVLSDFPLEMFMKEDIEQFIKHIFHVKNIKGERELISNINKISVDYNLSKLKMENETVAQFTKYFLDEINGYEPWNLENEIMINRLVIRSNKDKPLEVIKELIKVNESIIRCLTEEENMFLAIGIRHRNFLYLKHYMDYTLDGLLQIINYFIVSSNLVANEDKIKYLEEIYKELDELDNLLKFQINIRRSKDKIGNVNIEEAINIFVQYVEQRNEFKEYINILNLLEIEEKENKVMFGQVPDKFMVKKEILSIDEIYKMEHIITEGKKRREYKSEVEYIQNVIEYFMKYGGRDVNPYCIQDIKVFYREILMSKSKYRIQARKIVKNYMEECEKSGNVEVFSKRSEYMFIREKISRGYFREKKLLSYYNRKNKVHEKLYDVILKIYLLYDYNDILELIYDYNYRLLKKMKELFSEK